MMLHPQRRGIGQYDAMQDVTGSPMSSLTDASFSALPAGTASAGTAATDVGTGANITSQLNLQSILNSILPMQSNMAPGQKPPASTSMNNYLIIALMAFGAVVVFKRR